MQGLSTRLIHAGEEPRIAGAINIPVFHSAMSEYDGHTSDYNDLPYLRMGNSPTHRALHEKMASLEGAEVAVSAATGMAAISTTMLALLKPGDHLLAQRCLYGGTHDLFTKILPQWQIRCTFLDDDPARWDGQVTPETRMVYTETMTNPTLRVIDHQAVGAFAERHGLVAAIDSTFATPMLFRPLEHGYHLVLHSCTKYLNGHSDIVGGAIIGGKALVDKVRHMLIHLGGTMDPHACYLLYRGLKTLAARMRAQSDNALALARFLEASPHVAHVAYPGLESHPDHDLARKFFPAWGGVLSFEPASGIEPSNLIEALKIPVHTFSLGGVESLVVQPGGTSHAGLSEAEKQAIGVSDRMIRVSVGIEDQADLIADMAQALEQSAERDLR